MNDQQLLRYSRHILLEEIGIAGQERLLAARVLVIGAGGLGSPAAMYLAAAGVGHLTVADPDSVELSNLQRQIAHPHASLGQPKADSTARALSALNPDISIHPRCERLTGGALRDAVHEADVVLDCTDTFSSRDAINQACHEAKVPLVSGAAIGFSGQLLVIDPRQADSPCYHCLFPSGSDPLPGGCAHRGVFAALTGIVGTLQATEALKLAGGFGTPNVGALLQIDARTLNLRSTRIPRDPLCPTCAEPKP